MRLALPQSGIRRADVLVVALRGVGLLGWLIVDVVRRSQDTAHPFSFGLVAVLLVASLIEAPFLAAISLARRWGFAGIAILSGMGIVGSFTTPTMAGKPITAAHIVVAIVDTAFLLYCVVRLQQEPLPPGSTLPMP